MTNIDNLPAELRDSGLFCLWRYEDRGDKRTKVPYDPRTWRTARANDPDTFAPLALALTSRLGYDGLGVGIFGEICAIDIDRCIDEDGQFNDVAVNVMAIMGSYTELSPSGKGLRILFKAPGFEYDKAAWYINSAKQGLEVYVAGATSKYVTVTGDRVAGSATTLNSCSRQLRQVLDRYMRRQAEALPKPARTEGGYHGGSALTGADNDLQLLDKAAGAKGGLQFDALYRGSITGYASHSEADLALCSKLAFWTGCDKARMDRLFRRSGLMRADKWDREQSGSTYGALTIDKAVQGCRETWQPAPLMLRQEIGPSAEPAQPDTLLAALHPENNARYGWHDRGNGNLFADWSEGRAVYVADRGKWFVFSGKVWDDKIAGLKVMELCKELARALILYAATLTDEKLKQDYLKFIAKWQGHAYRETILKGAAGVRPVCADIFDADPWLFNCQNGTLDLRDGSFRAHRAQDMLARLSGVRFDPAALSPRWENFIHEVMQGDGDKAAFLRKALGYSLSGDTSRECFFMLYGPTSRNGKGTAMETFMRLMGDYGRTARPDSIAQKGAANGSGPTEDMARLAGARFVNIAEPDKQMKLSAALVKSLTGNDTLTARYLHENSFEYRPQFKLFINTNYLPSTSDVSLFTSGRVKIIPFERHFAQDEQDQGLKAELATDESLSGILNWCLEGLRMIGESGFDMPESVRDATDEYRRSSDKLGRFMEEEMEAGADYFVGTAEAYVKYKYWCVLTGHHTETLANFSSMLSGVAIVKRKRAPGKDRTANAVSTVIGYRLKPDYIRVDGPTPWDEDKK